MMNEGVEEDLYDLILYQGHSELCYITQENMLSQLQNATSLPFA